MANLWTPEEDKLLSIVAAKVEDGLISWDEAAEHIQDRSGPACQSRWDRIKNKRLIMPRERLAAEDTPTHQELYEYLRDYPRSLEQIANHFERSPAIITEKLYEMEERGYNLIRSMDEERVSVDTSNRPKVETPDIQIADMAGQEFHIAVASDWHAASKHSQPTHLNKFIHYAYEEYGVRHVFNPGDSISGVYGYRGHSEDLIQSCRPLSRKKAHLAVDNQVWLANQYAPQLPDLQYYNLGGNHDYWAVRSTGIDAVKKLCDQREDMIYMGYDVASIPLTDQTHLRLWHPSGGKSYAASYKIQKAMEQQAFEALQKAMKEEMPPKTSLLLAGHLHIAVFVPEPPMYGAQCACFEGRTNYLAKKGYTPHIGGIILRIRVQDGGKIGEIGYTYRHFEEIEEDWKSWPVPKTEPLEFAGEELDTIFKFEGDAPVEDL